MSKNYGGPHPIGCMCAVCCLVIKALREKLKPIGFVEPKLNSEITGTMAAQVLHEKMQELKARNARLEAVLAAAKAWRIADDAIDEHTHERKEDIHGALDALSFAEATLREAIRLCDSQEDGKGEGG